MSKDKKTREDFGWSKREENRVFKWNTSLPKGTFLIRRRKEKYYWYFQTSNIMKGFTHRLLYLTPTFEGYNDKDETSFDVCVGKLVEKVNSDYQKRVNRGTKLTTLIDDFVLYIRRDLSEQFEEETKKSTINSINQYRKWNVEQGRNIRMSNMMNPRELKEEIKSYLEYLSTRVSGSGKIGVSHNTKRTYLRKIVHFYNWLEDEDFGKGILPTNPITNDFVKKILPPSHRERTGTIDINHNYDSKWYNLMYKTCRDKVGNLWMEFVENGHSRKYTNQPIGVGSDIVWFISLLQLDSGFRIGELLESFRSRDDYMKIRDERSTKRYTYWEKRKTEYLDDNGDVKEWNGWCLYIYWKGKESIVPITTQIRSWKNPNFDGVESILTKDKDGKPLYWDTSIVDVCMKMFRPDSPYLFSSPNKHSNKLGHYSKTQYSNVFKYNCSTKGEHSQGWEGYGVFRSHNLRDYFITHKCSIPHLTIDQVSSITRNSVLTIERYYKRMDVGGQVQIQKLMDESRNVKGGVRIK